MFFVTKNRNTVLTEQPMLTFGEVGRELGHRWKSLSADDKVVYEDLAAKDKKRYLAEKEKYDHSKASAYKA